MIIAAAIAIVLAALYFTLRIRVSDVPEPVPVSPVQHLEDRKQAIYENLRDLQFEFRLGKLSDEDYKQTKLALQRELALVFSEMDEAVKRLGLSPVKTVAARPNARRTAPQTPAAAPPCPHCGARFAQQLKFCGECGKAMA